MKLLYKTFVSVCFAFAFACTAQAQRTWQLSAIDGSYVVLTGSGGGPLEVDLSLAQVSWQSKIDMSLGIGGGSVSLNESGAAYDVSYVYHCTSGSPASGEPFTGTYTSHWKFIQAIDTENGSNQVDGTGESVCENGTYNPSTGDISVYETEDLLPGSGGSNSYVADEDFIENFTVTVEPSSYTNSGGTCTANVAIPYTDYLGYTYAAGSLDVSSYGSGNAMSAAWIIAS